MAASTNDRQKEFVQRQKDQGRVPRKIYATPEEHRALLDYLRALREMAFNG